MKYPLLLSLILYSLEATDLTTLLQNAKNNLRVESARLMIDKSQAQLDEARSAYFPTISAAGLYQPKDKEIFIIVDVKILEEQKWTI